ncbi:MAG: PEP-CTERM sorting domain-containing protein [Alphaproteobacteria bacterium]|uniref:PEP-CTERM sorting domain-containing protein n=1 Tax=Candidatus Nitrobium versatile TaxID=2884831 RepID=A0A953M2C3_9BACT|nr:PEP-CTERM sorting domain-containing protein [Candidatus Nitrobium versatile]
MKRIYQHTAACAFLLQAMPALALPFSTPPPYPAETITPAFVTALSPIPEPSILLFLGAGLLLIGLKGQRKTGRGKGRE